MAKLNVTYPVVDVMVNGISFRKVDRKAQPGDIIKARRSSVDITEGAFYAVYADGDGDPAFRDDDGDARSLFLNFRDHYETLAPVTVTYEGATYCKVDRSAREGDVIVFTEVPSSFFTLGKPYLVDEIDYAYDAQITDDDGDEYDTAGDEFDVYEKVTEVAPAPTQPTVEYREVKRWAEKGERIRIVNRYRHEHSYEQGAEFIVNDTAGGGDVRVTAAGHDGRRVLLSEYAVLEPVTSAEPTPAPLKYAAGDYVKVTGNSAYHDYAVGSVVKITEVKDNAYYGGQQFRAEKADGERGNWLVTRDVEPAAEAEFTAQRTPALSVGDAVKLTITDGKSPKHGWGSVSNGDVGEVIAVLPDKIRVNFPKQRGWNAGPEELTKVDAVALAKTPEAPRLQVGEYARTLVAKDVPLGAIVKIERDDLDDTPFKGVQVGGRNWDWYKPAELEKVDAAEAQETAKWAEIGRKVGEYKVGDFVRITANTNSSVNPVGSVGAVTYVSGTDIRVDTGHGEWRNWTKPCEMELIAPVEQRFDTEQAA